jgi:hypothetical protein
MDRSLREPSDRLTLGWRVGRCVIARGSSRNVTGTVKKTNVFALPSSGVTVQNRGEDFTQCISEDYKFNGYVRVSLSSRRLPRQAAFSCRSWRPGFQTPIHRCFETPMISDDDISLECPDTPSPGSPSRSVGGCPSAASALCCMSFSPISTLLPLKRKFVTRRSSSSGRSVGSPIHPRRTKRHSSARWKKLPHQREHSYSRSLPPLSRAIAKQNPRKRGLGLRLGLGQDNKRVRSTPRRL